MTDTGKYASDTGGTENDEMCPTWQWQIVTRVLTASLVELIYW